MIDLRRTSLAIVICLFVAGCGDSDQAEVSGRVSLQGEPIVEGQIRFLPTIETNGPEFSAKIINGDYQVAKSVLPGKYAVELRAWKKTGRITKDLHGEMSEEMVNGIPPRYRGPDSELSADLGPGANTVDFELVP